MVRTERELQRSLYRDPQITSEINNDNNNPNVIIDLVVWSSPDDIGNEP